MKFVQLSAALLTAAFFLPGIARADGHGGAENAVANAVVDYWAARNAGDHKTVANLWHQLRWQLSQTFCRLQRR